MTVALLVLTVLLVGLAALAFGTRRRGSRRQQVLRQVLDSADVLEARLRKARAEIEAIAGDESNPVQDAMHEMLRQRLWLQQHGGDASLQQLTAVRDSIDTASRRIDQQLEQLERARAPQP